MSLTLYHYQRCTTSNKAKQLLTQKGVEFTERRYFDEPLSADELRQLARLAGGIEALVATRSPKYREMGLKDKHLSEDEWIKLIQQEPRLLRRPLLTDGQRIVVGLDAEAFDELIAVR